MTAKAPLRESGLRILVADDNAPAADMLAMVLRKHGHSVRVEYEGQATLDAATLEPFDVAVLDIEMPNVDGHRIAGAVRRSRPSTLLVAISAYGEPEAIDASRSAGFDSHFTKPVVFEEVAQAVRALHSRRCTGGGDAG